MKKQLTQAEIIKAVLPTSREFAMTVGEIYDSMDPADRGRFGSSGNVGKALNQMKSRHMPVANGDSEIINGTTRLTWYLTDENDSDKPQMVAPAIGQDDSAESEGEARPVSTGEDSDEVAEKPGKASGNHEAIQEKSSEQTQSIEAGAKNESQGMSESAMLFQIEMGMAKFIQGTRELLAERDRLAAELAEKPEPVTVERKALKIDTLSRLRNLLSDDIAVVLDEIAGDIERLQEAA